MASEQVKEQLKEALIDLIKDGDFQIIIEYDSSGGNQMIFPTIAIGDFRESFPEYGIYLD